MNKVVLPPLPSLREWPHSHEELRARDLEVAKVVLEAAAKRLEAQASNIDKLVSRDSWDASASSVRQGACYVRALEFTHD